MSESTRVNACLLCGAPSPRVLPDRHTDKGVSYTLYACDVCHGQFWTPFKNPGAEWYEHDERYASRNADPILRPNEKHRGVMEFLKGQKGRVLDIGCGVGNFLALAKARGWECWGIDFDRDAIVAAKQTYGLEHLEAQDLSQFIATHPSMKFDLAAFFDVFEHIDNHNEFLEEVKGILVPHGKLTLSVPYRSAWRWLLPADVPPRHLTRWDEASLRTILERHGFKIVFQRRFPATLNFLLMKFRFRYGKWATFNMVGKAKEEAQKSSSLATGASHGTAPTPSLKIRALHVLAKTKDIVLFGIPALVVWLVLLPSRKRYTDIYLVAEAV